MTPWSAANLIAVRGGQPVFIATHKRPSCRNARTQPFPPPRPSARKSQTATYTGHTTSESSVSNSVSGVPRPPQSRRLDAACRGGRGRSGAATHGRRPRGPGLSCAPLRARLRSPKMRSSGAFMPRIRPTRPEGQVIVFDMLLDPPGVQVSQQGKACRGRDGDSGVLAVATRSGGRGPSFPRRVASDSDHGRGGEAHDRSAFPLRRSLTYAKSWANPLVWSTQSLTMSTDCAIMATNRISFERCSGPIRR